MIFQIISLVLLLILVSAAFVCRKIIKRISDTAIAYQLAGQKLQREFNLLTEQYRQLANINKALLDVSKKKK